MATAYSISEKCKTAIWHQVGRPAPCWAVLCCAVLHQHMLWEVAPHDFIKTAWDKAHMAASYRNSHGHVANQLLEAAG